LLPSPRKRRSAAAFACELPYNLIRGPGRTWEVNDMRAAIVIGAFTILCAGASAKEGSGRFDALFDTVLPGRCDANACDWFSIESARLDGIGDKGELYKTQVRWWTSKPTANKNQKPPLKPEGDTELYVFCSINKPAVITRVQGNGWKAKLLAPERAESINGGNETSVALYWAVCHKAIEADVYKSGTALGKKLNYNVAYPFEKGDEIRLQSPLDTMKW
jgi:hypothetical protein